MWTWIYRAWSFQRRPFVNKISTLLCIVLIIRLMLLERSVQPGSHRRASSPDPLCNWNITKLSNWNKHLQNGYCHFPWPMTERLPLKDLSDRGRLLSTALETTNPPPKKRKISAIFTNWAEAFCGKFFWYIYLDWVRGDKLLSSCPSR